MSEMADIYLGLRNQFLATAPEHVDGGAPVYALLFEVDASGTIVTTASTAAGDASVYFSNGGGANGGIGIAEVRHAAKALVALAGTLFDSRGADRRHSSSKSWRGQPDPADRRRAPSAPRRDREQVPA
jgi:hypothetical protein